jgi:hypothetical protein
MLLFFGFRFIWFFYINSLSEILVCGAYDILFIVFILE